MAYRIVAEKQEMGRVGGGWKPGEKTTVLLTPLMVLAIGMLYLKTRYSSSSISSFCAARRRIGRLISQTIFGAIVC
ncbi:hypothetical protein CVT25_014167 [Psilocybe cyanescens]|uniref:Uncharacterized protein n=1 Tax=Psilocybe cyanescens TaxID=93625 RepID=A0A409XV00_PSICY|nr:hypothetical protein CVT25_014167 [Psilocybe cyanescens]